MGKKGDALRAKKKQIALYNFTGQQLEEHDRAVIAAYKETIRPRMMEEARKAAMAYEDEVMSRIHAEWDARAREFGTSDPDNNRMTLMSYMLAVPARVLIERFGWTPIEGHRYTKRNKIVRFCDAVIAEIEALECDDTKDIRVYSDETYKKYGVKFAAEDDE